jgi:hypothetical protein
MPNTTSVAEPIAAEKHSESMKSEHDIPGSFILGGASALAASLSGCGGGGDPSDSTQASTDFGRSGAAALTASNPITDWKRVTAHRFLTQATFGPIPDQVTSLANTLGTSDLSITTALKAWLAQQKAIPASASHFEATKDNYFTRIQYFFQLDEEARKTVVGAPSTSRL